MSDNAEQKVTIEELKERVEKLEEEVKLLRQQNDKLATEVKKSSAIGIALS